ncbi:MAG: acetyl-CoA hydrolase/transferase C-terminal domain-containing protein [Syntrophomonadaceae bacterium]|nr:acetyl-CoA hydrolase/transferase C-terminal domain-containing protein [Syntrophomonadaceae bacterium]
MSYAEEYRRKLVTPEEAVKVVKSGDFIDYGFGHTKPIALDAALAKRKDELKDIHIRVTLCMTPCAPIEADPEGEVFTISDWHFTGYTRKLHDRGDGRAFYNPLLFRNQPLFYKKSISNEVDVAMLRVTKMNKDGFFNFHNGCASTRQIIDVAKKVILEVNENLPWAMGGRDEVVHISEVDYIVEASSKVEVIPPATPSENDKKIASYIVPMIPSGACIQLGIGGLPNVVGTLLAESDLKDLGCQTEMLVDAYYHLYEAGKLTNRKKGVDKGKSTYAFAAGSQFLYDWLNMNPSLAVYPVSYTNNPWVMSQNPNMISINACIEVDLYGQISSESSGPRHISGTGGQLDFATGAYMSEGGISFICCNSSYKDKQGNVKSRIVPMLPQGSIVTVPRTQAHCIVTEYGVADIAGRSTWQRAEALINIAHPDLREELIKEAQKNNIWRRTNKIS